MVALCNDLGDFNFLGHSFLEDIIAQKFLISEDHFPFNCMCLLYILNSVQLYMISL